MIYNAPKSKNIKLQLNSAIKVKKTHIGELEFNVLCIDRWLVEKIDLEILPELGFKSTEE